MCRGLCNLCVLRLCNTYVENLATYMCGGPESLIIIPCTEQLRVLFPDDSSMWRYSAQMAPQFSGLLNGGCEQGGPNIFSQRASV